MVHYNSSRTWVTARASDALTEAFITLYRLVRRDVYEWNSLYENDNTKPLKYQLEGSPKEQRFAVITVRKLNTNADVSRHVTFTQLESTKIEITSGDGSQTNPSMVITVDWDQEEACWKTNSDGNLLDLSRVSQYALEGFLFPNQRHDRKRP